MHAGIMPPFFSTGMETARNPTWEEDSHTPVRACSQENGGGAPGPSTSKADCASVKRKLNTFGVLVCGLLPHAGPGDMLKGASPSLGANVHYFHVPFLVGHVWKKAMHE